MQRHVHHGPFPVVDDSEEHFKCETLQVQQLLVEGEGVGEGRGSIELGACGEEYEAASQEVERAASGRPPQAASSDGRLPSTPHLQLPALLAGHPEREERGRDGSEVVAQKDHFGVRVYGYMDIMTY